MQAMMDIVMHLYAEMGVVNALVVVLMEDNFFSVLKMGMKWHYYKYWGHFHNEGDNSCLSCKSPAYKRWDKRYNGFIGFCTVCDDNWRES